MICWHRWGKWSSPTNGIFAPTDSVGYFAVCQLRLCEKCGKADYRRLPRMRSLEELKGQKP